MSQKQASGTPDKKNTHPEGETPPEQQTPHNGQPKTPTDGEKRTPDAWAVHTKRVRKLKPNIALGGNMPTEAFTPDHLAAAQFHGWNVHAFHTADAHEITLEQYEEAINAAGLCVYPHEPACSPYLKARPPNPTAPTAPTKEGN